MDFFTPAMKCTCPSCFEELFIGECKIVSGRTSGKVLKDPGHGRHAQTHVEPLVGRAFTLELAQRQCYQCNYLLPHNIERVPNLTFVVVGDVSSGKSYYLAALIHQIETEWMGNASGYAKFVCLTPDVQQMYERDYFKPLESGTPIARTRPAPIDANPKPLIYNLVTTPFRKRPTREINIMIYDASGEDFETYEKLVNVARFTLNTNAFIFVVDPFSMIPLIQQLPQPFPADIQQQITQAQGRRAAHRLNSVIDLIERYRAVPSGSSFHDTPIAVMVSKSDIFATARPGNDYYFKTYPRYGDGVNLQDINAVDREIRYLLKEEYGQGDLLTATYRFGHVNFFATSATGASPNALGQYQNVKPRRCLDPLLWILKELEILEANG